MTTDASPLPVYQRDQAPEHLRTVTQLKTDRLKLADGQQPVAYLKVLMRGAGWQEVPLYESAAAVKMRPLSAKQQQAVRARRTCPECGEVRKYVVHVRCEECREKAEQAYRDLYERTCRFCRRVSAAELPFSAPRSRACEMCRVWHLIKQHVKQERVAAWARTCPGEGCEVQTATDEEVAAARKTHPYRPWSPRWCPPCEERAAVERAEREQRQREAEQEAAEAREREVRGLEAWAAAALDDPRVVILDTETTGLDDDARIVDIAVTTVDGRPLVNTLINPGVPIPYEATSVHGITNQLAARAPAFGDVLPALAAALEGKRCLIYNKAYDVARLRYELTLHYAAVGHDYPAQAVADWLDRVEFEDVMVPYSTWVGEWSGYWGGYAWQPLGGSHRALGDCRAVADCLRAMAGVEALPEELAGHSSR
ncbi:exonuclease domain-containing protein [Streptomyces sp. NPDC059679]|uniref:exonuclease domain-containing protein n=1 Tax=Streptomyces sp. NPDC059679 TaxID=3346903 RepID=UPI00368B974F